MNSAPRAFVTVAVLAGWVSACGPTAVRKNADAPPPPFVVCVMVLEDGSDLQGRGD